MKRFLSLMAFGLLASVSMTSCVSNRRPVGAADTQVVQAATFPVIRQSNPCPDCPECPPASVHDTVFVFKTVEDTIQRRRADSMGNLWMASDYKIARVKYYLRIAINKPSQRQFLVSWLRRIFGM